MPTMSAHLSEWLKVDLAAAIEWHEAQSGRLHDPVLRASETAKADMAKTVLRRLDAYNRGEEPITSKKGE